MAVPKRRTSRSRKGTRRSHHHVTPVQVQFCPKCKAVAAGEADRLADALLDLPTPRAKKAAPKRSALKAS